MTAHPFTGPIAVPPCAGFNLPHRLQRANVAAALVFRQVARGQPGENLLQAFKLAAPCAFDDDAQGVAVICFGITGPRRPSHAAAVIAWAKTIEDMVRAPRDALREAIACC